MMVIEKKNRGLLFVLVAILCFMYILVFVGGMHSANDAVVQYAKKITAGYSECIYSVEIGENGVEPLALVGGDGITQPIYMDEEMLTNEKLMLGFYMATYARENMGKLYVELRQEDEIQTYVTEMEEMEDNADINLVFSTERFYEGTINVRIYSPDSTWENCVALYLTNDSSTYDAIYMNGEQIEKNAVIRVCVPSRLTKSDFEYVSL